MGRAMTESELCSPRRVVPGANLPGALRARLGGPGEGQVDCRIRWRGDWLQTRCHRLLVPQMERFFELVEAIELSDRLETFDGCYVYRTKRGGSDWSTHAWGAAFDVNAAWNPMGAEPPAIGAAGSVRELVPVAARCGYGWGGWWSSRYRDGMHFQAVRVVPEGELPELRSAVEILVPGRAEPLAGELIHNRSYAPVRELGEALGLAVGWDGEAKRVVLSRPED